MFFFSKLADLSFSDHHLEKKTVNIWIFMCQQTNSFIDWLQIQALVMCSIDVLIIKVHEQWLKE